jgi:hypothetical protein
LPSVGATARRLKPDWTPPIYLVDR